MCKFTVVYLHDPLRGGVSKFFRCEAPFWHHHEIEWQDHAFTARTEGVDSTPATSFFAGSSAAPLLGPLRTRKVGRNLLGLRRLEEVLEVTVL